MIPEIELLQFGNGMERKCITKCTSNLNSKVFRNWRSVNLGRAMTTELRDLTWKGSDTSWFMAVFPGELAPICSAQNTTGDREPEPHLWYREPHSVPPPAQWPPREPACRPHPRARARCLHWAGRLPSAYLTVRMPGEEAGLCRAPSCGPWAALAVLRFPSL